MSKLYIVGTAAAVLTLSGTAIAQSGGAPVVREIQRAGGPGRAVFEHNCASCHGTGPGGDGATRLPGTAALAARYQGAVPAELERRGDLNAAVLQIFVRRGRGEMPGFRPSEISDEEIGELARYLATTAQLNAKP